MVARYGDFVLYRRRSRPPPRCCGWGRSLLLAIGAHRAAVGRAPPPRAGRGAGADARAARTRREAPRRRRRGRRAMTGFVVVAAAMLVVALAFLLVPLLARRSAAVAIDRDASNVALLREQLRELDARPRRRHAFGRAASAIEARTRARVLEEAPRRRGCARRPSPAPSPPAVLGALRSRARRAAYLAWGGLEAFSARRRRGGRTRPARPVAGERSRKWSASSPRGCSRNRTTPRAGSSSRVRTTR